MDLSDRAFWYVGGCIKDTGCIFDLTRQIEMSLYQDMQSQFVEVLRGQFERNCETLLAGSLAPWVER